MCGMDIGDVLVRAEIAMLAEGVEGWRVERVINRLVYGEPDGPDARCTSQDEAVDDASRAYEQTRRSTVVSLRALHDTLSEAASPMNTALRNAVAVVAEQLAAPSPLDGTPIAAYDMVVPDWPEPSVWAPLRASKDPRCYTASFGPVHYRGCGCKR